MKQLMNLVIVAGVFLTGCVSTSTFDEKQAELAACQKQAKSDLDACKSARSEIPYDKKILSLTSVGFANGQGITLVGIQPGVNKGKQVRVTAEFIGNINGTDVFTVKQISALKAPEVEIIPAPAPAVTITPTPTAAVQETVKSPAPVISPQPVAATVAEPPKSPGQ